MPAPVAHAVAAIRRGEIIVVVDDPDREDEGDFVMAAQRATPAAVNRMVTHGRGLLCLPMEGARLDMLGVPDMVPGATAETAFTVSVDLDEPGRTGISAADRARCIRHAVDPAARPGDFRRPGHVFPLRARPGGVLERRGHTEAAVDLARLAGLAPAGVICEILAEDGSMARGTQLAEVARRHGMPLISVADLVSYRRTLAPTLRRSGAAADIPTPFGNFRASAYVRRDGTEHIALVRGEPSAVDAPVVRVHSECVTGDLFASLRCDCGLQLRSALRRIAEDGCGVLVYLRGHEGRGIGLPAKLAAYRLQDAGHDTVQANLELGLPVDARDYGDAAEILLDLGLPAVRLLTNNPAKTARLRAAGLDVVPVPLRTTANPHNVRYLRTKRDRLGHDLGEEPVSTG